jgi:hypothetical protein
MPLAVSGLTKPPLRSNALGYGRGGVAGIYSVSDTNDDSCVTQPEQPAYQWPSNILTNALSAATLPVTERASSNSGDGLSGGAIAGIVIGVVAALAIVGFALWFLLRRKRSRERAAHIEPLGRKETSHEVDLADDLGPYTETNSGRSVAAPMIARSGLSILLQLTNMMVSSARILVPKSCPHLDRPRPLASLVWELLEQEPH